MNTRCESRAIVENKEYRGYIDKLVQCGYIFLFRYYILGYANKSCDMMYEKFNGVKP